MGVSPSPRREWLGEERKTGQGLGGRKIREAGEDDDGR